MRPNACEQLSHGYRLQTFNPNAHHRWRSFRPQNQQGMKIGIERNANPVFAPRVVQNLQIRGAAHADFTDMNHIPAFSPQVRSGPTRQSLVERS